jgi:GAF domain
LDADRTRRIAARFTPVTDTPPNASLCQRCVEILQVEGAGVSIMSGRNSGPVCSSSERVRQLEDLQFSLGEGPCHDAYTTGSTVAEPDLASRTSGSWPNYAPSALDLGACAVFAFPLQLGAGIVGVLTLYHDVVGMLTDEQDADGRVLARMLPTIMSAIQARDARPLLACELSDADAHRAEVHQASGMTAVQLGIGVDDALVRIRAHAYASSRTVAHVAGQILAHRLHLGDDGRDNTEHPHE